VLLCGGGGEVLQPVERGGVALLWTWTRK
jgi:hypothetical protein